MNLKVEQGGTIRLPADFSSEDQPCDPLEPLVHIFNPAGEPVAEWLVPTRVEEGVYYVDFDVDVEAPLGSWTARWTGTINGEPVGGEDTFEVSQPGVVESVSTSAAEAESAEEAKEPAAKTVPRGRKVAKLERVKEPAGAAPAAAKGKARKPAEPGDGGTKRRRGVRPLAIGVAVIMLVAAAAFYRQAQSAKVQRTFEAGDEAFLKGNFAEAEKLYFEVLEKDANNKFALFDVGVLAQRQQRIAEAQHYYDRALEVDPEFLPALYNKAYLLESMNKSQEAVETYRTLLKSSPNHAPSHFNLGLLLFAKLNQPEEGKKEMSEALKLDPALTSQLDPKLAAELTPPNEPAP